MQNALLEIRDLRGGERLLCYDSAAHGKAAKPPDDSDAFREVLSPGAPGEALLDFLRGAQAVCYRFFGAHPGGLGEADGPLPGRRPGSGDDDGDGEDSQPLSSAEWSPHEGGAAPTAEETACRPRPEG
ncbi:unnamed protein product [Phytomonas sp. EM1]|nr:unnamed protein product [Phytomonas sp. EM1]|eukprot:CCW64972.1 unnamed protein product [Phytomonas sp. isolate EM1]